MYVCMSLVMMLSYIILQTGEIEKGQLREKIMFEMSTTDVLTKHGNRRSFENALIELSGIRECMFHIYGTITDMYLGFYNAAIPKTWFYTYRLDNGSVFEDRTLDLDNEVESVD